MGDDSGQEKDAGLAEELGMIARCMVENIGKGVYKTWVIDHLKKAQVKFRNVKKQAKLSYAIVTFNNETELSEAMPKLEALLNKQGKPVEVRPLASPSSRRAEKNSTTAQAKSVEDATAPWRDVPYEEQLQRKQLDMVKVLQRISSMLVEAESKTQEVTPLPQWLLDRPDSFAFHKAKSTKERRDTKKENRKRKQAERNMAKEEVQTDTPPAKSRKTDQGSAPAPTTESTPTSTKVKPEEEKPEEETRGFKGVGTHLEGTVCPLERILPSPKLEGYRNKCEFTIGKDDAGEIVVGFRSGGFQAGSVLISPPGNCVIVPDAMLEFAATLESFLKNSSKLPVYDLVAKAGFWRNLMLRYFESTKSLMAMMILRKGDMEQTEIDAELQALVKFVTQDGKTYAGASLKCFAVTYYDGPSSPDPNDPFEILFGESHIYDILDGMSYAVSPQAFFQVNSAAAEVLYGKVREWALAQPVSQPLSSSSSSSSSSAAAAADDVDGTSVDPAKEGKQQKVVFDVCCGTGTIGLSMARHFDHLIGVDSSTAAIDDARKNAEANNTKNAHFVAAMAEDVMHGFFSRYATEEDLSSTEKGPIKECRDILLSPDSETTAIVDPPRIGLHKRVIREIRSCEAIKRLVYVSCNPTGEFLNNVVALCRAEHKKQRPGTAFWPVKAIPVDLFPHTKHCELIMLFERLPSTDFSPLGPKEQE